ncbi:MAG: energy-coupling factor transporter transmembrane component T, partial [Tissierellia bacterium]|nr:energy-coupling factor transporter transmembrane component T [Tissierellia bacterium]
FPVLKNEMVTIRSGIKARGIFSAPYDYLIHPVIAYESFFVPLTIRCIKISEELGATAELRGLDSNKKRTSIYRVGFSVYDYITIIIYSLIMILIYLGEFL